MAIPADPRPDDFAVVRQALLYAAQEARQGGMPDIADDYELVLVRLMDGDLELNRKAFAR